MRRARDAPVVTPPPAVAPPWAETPPLALDPAAPGFAADPFPVYEAVRSAGGVAPVALPNGSTAWVVVDHALARSVLRDSRSFSADPRHGARGTVPRLLERHMLNLDAPDHPRLRAAVASRFSGAAVEALRPRVEAVSAELLAALPSREVDLVSAYAFPLPTLVVFDVLGVPLADRDELRALTAAVATPRGALPEPAALEHAWAALEAYFRTRVADARQRALPAGEDRPSGLFDALAVAGAESALSDDELLATCFLLLFAGYETAMNLIGSMAWLLLGGRLAGVGELGPAVEECLRWASPIEGATWRYAREGASVGGVTVPPGASVLVSLAAANRDPAAYPSPEDVDPSREGPAHLAFGYGVHHCLGARLGRLEGEVALRDLLAAAPRLEPAVPLDAVPWRPGLLVRGPARLPVRVAPPTAAG